MTEERLFSDALEKTTPEERHAFLAEACGADADLRRRVEELLRLHDATGGLLDKSPPTLTMAPPAPGEPPGMRIGPYKLLEKIGEGGMGTVYMAEQDKPVRRRVALKIIKAGMDSTQVVARFEAERQALALMDHPNIAKVLDGGATEANRPYFVMELVKGIPITKFCDEQRLTPRQRLDLFLPVCQAVQHAHQKGIIHRDLKPSNILVALYDDKPVPKVIDFGVAKATGERLTDATLFTGFGAVVGTLEYMSPEQARMNALDVDTRADIYSLGVVLYELLTGSTPFDKTRWKQAAYDEWLRIIREEEPARPSTRLSSAESPASVAASRNMEPAQLTRLVRGELDWIVMKSLEKDRTRRYETANGLARDIQRYLADEAVEACPPSARYRLGKLVRKHKRSLATAAALVLVLIAGVIISSWLAVRATEAEELAGKRLYDVETAKNKLQGALAETKEAHGKTSKALAETRLANATTKSALEALSKANEKTKEALKDSEEARKQAEEVSRFMTEAFRRASPSVDGRNLKVADVLSEAEAKLDARKDLSPLVRADLYAAIGGTYLGLWMHEEAIRTQERAWALRKLHLGTLHAKTINDLSILHGYYLHLGKRAFMASRFEEALNEGLTAWPPEHPTNRALALKTVEVWMGAEQPEKALALLDRFPSLLEPRSGASDAVRLETVTAVTKVYAGVGQCDKAVKLMEDHIASTKAALGPAHLTTITAMNNLADVWWSANFPGDKTGKQRQAARLMGAEQRERTLTQARASLGNEHPFTQTCLSKLANDLSNAKLHARAAAIYAEILEQRSRAHGADSYAAWVNGWWLGQELVKAGKNEQAIPVLEKVVSNQRFREAQLQVCMYYLAMAYQEMGDFAKADPLLTTSLELSRKSPLDQFFTHSVTLILARNKLHLGKIDEAEKLLDSVAANRRSSDYLSQRGAMLLQQQEYAKAEPLLLAAYPGVRNMRDQVGWHLHFKDNLNWLVRLYEEWGKADEAEKWRAVRGKAKSQPTK